MEKTKDKKKFFNFTTNRKSGFILLCFLSFIFFMYINNKKEFNNDILINSSKTNYFDYYQVFKYNEIKQKLVQSNCSQMIKNEREFLNGIIRKFKPKKFLEVGVNYGGSSIIILNAIDDINGAKLYSIDLNNKDYVGFCVHKYFPQFLKNWILYKGNIATEFMEKLGNKIDMAFFDTSHLEPGEILDFLIVLPFLKEEAIVIFHDIAKQMFSKKRAEYAPYIIYNEIKGYKYLPSGNYILKQNIGAIKLDKNQKNYYKDYFRLLGGQWHYFPKEIHIISLRNFFKKYYDEECLIIFEEAVEFNRIFVKNNQKPKFYKSKYISD